MSWSIFIVRAPNAQDVPFLLLRFLAMTQDLTHKAPAGNAQEDGGGWENLMLSVRILVDIDKIQYLDMETYISHSLLHIILHRIFHTNILANPVEF